MISIEALQQWLMNRALGHAAVISISLPASASLSTVVQAAPLRPCHAMLYLCSKQAGRVGHTDCANAHVVGEQITIGISRMQSEAASCMALLQPYRASLSAIV